MDFSRSLTLDYLRSQRKKQAVIYFNALIYFKIWALFPHEIPPSVSTLQYLKKLLR